MSTFTSAAAHVHAINLVTTALGSGEIKLLGANWDQESNEKAAKHDADYLNALINSIAKNLTVPF